MLHCRKGLLRWSIIKTSAILIFVYFMKAKKHYSDHLYYTKWQRRKLFLSSQFKNTITETMCVFLTLLLLDLQQVV